MDIPLAPVRPDVVGVQTSPRPTATPTVSFSEVMAGGARALVQGAQAAVRALPGSPLMAVALRSASGASGAYAANSFGGSPAMASLASVPVTPEGPGGTSSAGTTSATGTASSSSESSSDASIQASMAQSEQMNLYYLQVQEQVNSQNRTFTALSNVLEVEHSTAKAAITNIH
jgi:hypothetical protein